MKQLFELITDKFSLFDNALYNYFAMAIIGVIAFNIAYYLVGQLYKSGDIHGRLSGSLLHWIIRLIVFVGIL